MSEKPDKIVCLGKNYAEHAKELGEALPEKPVLFIKPASILISVNSGEIKSLQLPKGRGSVHHECEIVMKMGSQQQIEAVTLGLDMTLRDVQNDLKKKGHPWTISKVFQDSAVVGPWIPVENFPNWQEQFFEMKLNGQLKQKGSVHEMLLKPMEAISYLGQYFSILKGDLVFTGTPKGVGPVNSGDRASLIWGPINFEVKWL